MKITKDDSLKTADKVLANVKSALTHCKLPGSLTLRCWSNGREQGYCLAVYPINYSAVKAIVFARQRNSEQVVVCAGNADDFDFQTNQPNDQTWENHQCFKTVEAAADHVAKYIINSLYAGTQVFVRKTETDGKG